MTSTADTNYLSPGDLTFFRAPEGDVRLRMVFRDEWCCVDVRVSQLLPISKPGRYWAIRNADDLEIGVLLDLDGLDEKSRALLVEESNRRYFLPKVLSVQKVKDEFGVVVWDVTTDAGPRRYTIRNLRDNAIALSATRLMMTDVDGNRFEFPNIENFSGPALDVLMKVV